LAAGKDVSTEAEDIVEIRYQATTGEDIANREELGCAVVRSRVRELVRALNSLVVTGFKCPINPVTNRNRMSSN
jgi:hypothetical protein